METFAYLVDQLTGADALLHSITLNALVHLCTSALEHLCTCNSSFVAVNLTATAQLQRIKSETIVHLFEIQLGSKYMLFWLTLSDMTDYQ